METTLPSPEKHVALFLGAGASKTFGVPLTNEIFTEILQRCAARTLFQSSSDPEGSRQRLFNSLKGLLPGLDLPRIKLPLITDVVSLIDYSLSASIIPIVGMDQHGLWELRALLARAIAEIVDVRPQASENPLYEQWTRWLHDLQVNTTVSVLTSNYDIVAERPVLLDLWAQDPSEPRVYQKLDFGFGWRVYYDGSVQRRPQTSRISFFKLHGSVNWLACEVCEHIYIQHWAPSVAFGYDVSGPVRGRSNQPTVSVCHCDHGPLVPMIVAPSLVREIRNPNLLEIWKNALEALRHADEWIIIGYSLPPEDLAIRSMFLRAWQSRKQKPRVTVVQRGNRQETRSRYRLLFPNCRYLTGGLGGYLNQEVGGV